MPNDIRRSPANTRLAAALDVSRNGKRIVVTRNEKHPEYYLWIKIDERAFFLGCIEHGMTRRDVRILASQWLEAHTHHWQ